jgi:uncharacterized repeat protein (TIGR01451 family)
MPVHIRSDVSRARRKRARPAPAARLLLPGALILMILFVVVPAALADIEVPAEGLSAFIQTTGPLATLGIGDYRTNNPVSVTGGSAADPSGVGDNSVHQMVIEFPCVTEDWELVLFDPAIGDAADSIDEPRDDSNDDTGDSDWYDNTTFRLRDPSGTVIAEETYTPGTSEGAATTFTTVSVDASSCGQYVLETYTGNDESSMAGLTEADLTGDLIGLNNDDNAWRLIIPDGDTGPDGIAGTGDEALVALRAVSYQHSSDASCQDFYWFVDDNDTQLYIINFDMDDEANYGLGNVCYFPPGVTGPSCVGGYPGGDIIEGTRSSNTSWNDESFSASRPSFGDMATFDIAGGDLQGDAISSPPSGIWRAQICVDSDNQYSLEVPGYDLYVELPVLPQLTIEKDDGVDIVSTPGSTSYTVTITNEGEGAAFPLPGSAIELTDELPPGMTFDSCTVNAPLVGTCSFNSGTGLVEVDLTGHTTYPNIILPGVGAAGNSGTVTVNALVDAGLTGGTLLENVATVDYTDALGSNYEPVSDNDIDTVGGGGTPQADLSLEKTVDATIADVGDTVTYTIEVTNSGPNDTTGVTVTDDSLTTGNTDYTNLTLPAGSPTQGTYDTATGVWTVGALAVGQSETLTVEVELAETPPLTNIAEVTSSDLPDPDSTPNNGDPGEDDQDDATISPPGVPMADLSLDKSASTSNADVGDVLTYMIEVTNSGPDDTTGVTVTDDSLTTANPAYASVTVAAASPTQGTYDTATGVWTVGALAVGQSESLAIQVELAESPPLTNVAEVTSSDLPDPDSTPGNGDPGEDDQDDVTIDPPGTSSSSSDNDESETSTGPTATPAPAGSALLSDPTLSKSVSSEDALIGETVIWTINVSNPTDGALENVVVTDSIPSMFDVVRVSSSQGDASASGNGIRASIGTLEPGESAVINVETIANDLGAPPASCNVALSGNARSNEVCVNIFPEELPALGGGRPPVDAAMGGLWLLFLAGAGFFLTVGWAIIRWSRASRRL